MRHELEGFPMKCLDPNVGLGFMEGDELLIVRHLMLPRDMRGRSNAVKYVQLVFFTSADLY